MNGKIDRKGFTERLKLYIPTFTSDTTGGRTATVALSTTVWGRVEESSNSRRQQEMQDMGFSPFHITIAYKSTLAINEDWIIGWVVNGVERTLKIIPSITIDRYCIKIEAIYK
jgi:head-tail adaptor